MKETTQRKKNTTQNEGKGRTTTKRYKETKYLTFASLAIV
jgi:hypothetical protein